MKEEFIAGIVDSKGIRWTYEGTVQGHPIWTMKNKSRPALLTEEEANQIAQDNLLPGDKIVVERA